MANNLTGDYEAVLQVSLRQVNGILATLHQNKIDPTVSPSFEHSAAMRLGRPPLSLDAELLRFKGWAASALAGVERAELEPRARLSLSTPPGLHTLYEAAWHKIDLSLVEPASSSHLRGLAEVQLSNASISMPAGWISRVMVQVYVRARFLPDPGTATLPAPIHGEVRAVYTVSPHTLGDGRRVVRVQPSASDADIQFAAMPGTIGSLDADTIAKEVRTLLRTRFAPLDVTVDNDFAFTEVATVGAGPQQAIVLPLTLSGGEPVGAIASVSNHLLGGKEFAIAVSREYFQAFFDQFIEGVKAKARLEIKSFWADYDVSVTSLTVSWKAGYLELAGYISLTTDSVLPNGFISFTQNLEIKLDVATQAVSLVAMGDANVDESWWLPHSTALKAVRDARDSGLPGASASLNANAGAARHKLVKALASFDKSAGAVYASAETTPDGLILRGTIQTNQRLEPKALFTEIDGGAAFSAHQSWIPGGRIEEFVWSWVERTSIIPWFNTATVVEDADRFVFPKPPGLSLAPRMCLLIRGKRADHNGWVEDVSGGEFCKVSSHEPVLVAPPWWAKLMVPIWWPYPADRGLDQMIAAHVNVLADRPTDRPLYNTLIHFTGPGLERPLDQLTRVMSQVARRDASLVVMVVLPSGSLSARRTDVERQLGSASERFTADLEITEDYAGGWTQVFAPREATSTHLLDAWGALAWQQDGPMRIEETAAAIDRHAVQSPAPQRVAQSLNVAPGDRAPDSAFADDRGTVVALRRLRGRAVVLAFWQSWSAPCIEELRQLERNAGREGAPYVLAINGGESLETIAEARARHGLSLAVVPDRDQRIASAYGVKCWPTTISITVDGIVDRIQFGLSHPVRQARTEQAS